MSVNNTFSVPLHAVKTRGGQLSRINLELLYTNS